MSITTGQAATRGEQLGAAGRHAHLVRVLALLVGDAAFRQGEKLVQQPRHWRSRRQLAPGRLSALQVLVELGATCV